MQKVALFLSLPLFLNAANAQLGPEITSWIHTDGEFGSYYNLGNFTPIATTDTANVKNIFYNATDVYIRAGGVPAYPTGPFQDGNPSLTSDGHYTFRIPRNPQMESGTPTVPGLGQIGVFINGVPMYNYADAMSYNNLGIWHRNAIVAENAGFDCAKGHPAMTHYHHHQSPHNYNNSLAPMSFVCDDYPASALYTVDSTVHSPILGYAFDGYPVYGPYAYSNTNGTGGIRRMESSFRLRNITDRTTLPDGTVLTAPQYGPAIGGSYPLGLYKEDFEFVVGLGDLDSSNGRFCITPEYPAGIFCYFATVDADWNAAFPYLIGEFYYGVVAADNFPSGGPGSFSTSVSMPGGLTEYNSVGIEEHTILDEINMYPNPASAFVRFSFPDQLDAEMVTVEIISLTGQKISSTNISSSSSMDVSGLMDGVYIVSIIYNDEQTSKRLMVIK
jgi:hypothetical protein